MKKEHIWTKWLYWFLFAVAVIFVYKTLDSLSSIMGWIRSLFEVLMPFIIGILIAYLFYLPVRSLEKFYKKSSKRWIQKKARVFSIMTVYLVAFIALILIFNFVLPAVTQSIVELANNLPNYYKSSIENLKNLPQEHVLNQLNIQGIIQSLENIDIGQFFNFETITSYIKSAIDLVSGVFGIFVAVITSIYLLIERTDILKFAKELGKAIFKTDLYQAIGKYFAKCNEVFFRFISSQFLDAIVVGILVSIAMLILDVKYAILLGFLIGLSNMIPYWGAIFGVGVSIIITAFTGGVGQAIWMGIIVIILQQIDANIINPKIVGNSLKISPLLVIFSVTIGGAYFGILGMFLAVPIVTVIKTILTDYVKYKNQKKDVIL